MLERKPAAPANRSRGQFFLFSGQILQIPRGSVDSKRAKKGEQVRIFAGRDARFSGVVKFSENRASISARPS